MNYLNLNVILYYMLIFLHLICIYLCLSFGLTKKMNTLTTPNKFNAISMLSLLLLLFFFFFFLLCVCYIALFQTHNPQIEMN